MYFSGERLLGTDTRGVLICLHFVIKGREEQVHFWAPENILGLHEKDFLEARNPYINLSVQTNLAFGDRICKSYFILFLYRL